MFGFLKRRSVIVRRNTPLMWTNRDKAILQSFLKSETWQKLEGILDDAIIQTVLKVGNHALDSQVASISAQTHVHIMRRIYGLAGFVRKLEGGIEQQEVSANIPEETGDKNNLYPIDMGAER
jgi:hypothetical protein